NEQRERGAFAGSGERAGGDIHHRILERLGDTAFLGYEGTGHEGEGTLRAIITQGGAEADRAQKGQEVELVFDRTPFYGESGGQVGDTGRILGAGGKAEAQVLDTQRPVPGLLVHRARVILGEMQVGSVYQLSVDGERREALRANHSATHLLHRALKI